MEEYFGNLTVRAYTAGGGLPVSGARVRIVGAEEENRNVTHTLITDKDGKTEQVALPAPLRSNSLSPEKDSDAYSRYDVEIEKEGYYSKKIFGSAVFAGINSLLLINMIPISEGGQSDYPRGNINSVIIPEVN